MTAFSALEPRINLWLLEKLLALDCMRGRLEANGEAARLSISGKKANGQPVFSLVPDPKFAALISEYLAAHDILGRAQFFIEVDVQQATFHYSNAPTAERPADRPVAPHQQTEAPKQHPRQTTPYGPALAGQVADVLGQGRQLAPYHRDYCGMGLRAANGHYHYGEVWDGQLTEPTRTFADRSTFVDWLARQSDKALARLEEENQWYWNNQTITRQRLEDFVR